MQTRKQKLALVISMLAAFALGMATLSGCALFTEEKIAATASAVLELDKTYHRRENEMNTIQKIFESEISDGIINGSAVFSGTLEQDLYKNSFGFADNSHKVPMRTDTVIDIASVTKAAACITALLVCHSRGLIDFDRPFTEYLPEYRAKLKEAVTVRDLANHCSGFYELPGESRPYFDESGRKMLEKVLTLPPPHPRTINAHYACWNYILLGQIVEKITGVPFAEFCRKEIFLPLEMNDSSLGSPLKHIPPERLAQTIGTDRPGMISDFVACRLWRDGISTGNAGMFSSAEDLAKLLRCYLRHGAAPGGQRIFSEEAFAQIAPDRGSATDGYRRFGWVICDSHMPGSSFGTSLLHSGWSGQTLFMDFRNDFFAVVLTTRCGDYDRAKTDRFRVIEALSNPNFLSEQG